MRSDANNRYRKLALQMLYYCENDNFDISGIDPESLAITGITSRSQSVNELKALHKRIRNSPKVDVGCQQTRSQWQRKLSDFERLFDKADLYKFSVDLMSNIDRGLLFSDSVLSGTTRIAREWIGQSRARAEVSMPCWGLHFTSAGKSLYVGDKQELSATPGTVVLMRPNTVCQQGLHPKASQWDHTWVLFQPRPHWLAWLNWGAGAGLSALFVDEARLLVKIEALFEGLAKTAQEPPLIRDELAMNCLEEILLRLQVLRDDSLAQVLDARIVKVCAFVLENLHERHSMPEIAGLCNLSVSRLSHLFAEHMGLGLVAWRNQQRMQKARKSLVFTSDAIAVIAASIGFSDQLQFSKSFRKNTGCSPTEFRKEFR